MSRARPIRRQRGLTLIEVAVSMVVLAVAAFGVAASMMTGMASTRRYQQNTLVIARAQHAVDRGHVERGQVFVSPRLAGGDQDRGERGPAGRRSHRPTPAPRVQRSGRSTQPVWPSGRRTMTRPQSALPSTHS